MVVVDDGSPAPAADELTDVMRDFSNVTVIRQENSGPGAARNRGLESIDPDTEYVAFVDSDDRWEPAFLSDALFALSNGGDLFFGDTQRFGNSQTRFKWDAVPGYEFNPDRHILIDASRKIYRFEGDFFDFAIFRSSIISTSTMVYRFAKFPALRFSERLFNGQDRLFKLSVSRNAKGIFFTARVCAQEGRGVNIFDSSSWGSEKSLNLLYNYIKLSKCILKEIPMNDGQRSHVRSQLESSRYSFAATLLHLLARGVRIDHGVLMGTFKADPATAVCLMPNLLKVLIKKVCA